MKTLYLNERRAKAICSAIRRGLSRQDAADRAGVHRDTMYDWLKRGSEAIKKRDALEELTDDERRLVDFYLRYKRAARCRKLALLSRIESAASGHEVAAGTWLLEVFAPDEFGKRSRDAERSDDERDVQVIVNVSTSPHAARPSLDADTEAE